MTRTCAHCGTALDPKKNPNHGRAKFCGRACYILSPRTPEAIAARFWAKVEKRDDGCWLWKACRSSVTRYGTFSYHGSNINAHRAAWLITYGPIEGKGIDVLHRCNNGHLGCVTPAHLYLGTDKDNTADKIAAGRTTYGERNHTAKLTEVQAKEILAAFKRTGPMKSNARELAAKYGVTAESVNHLVAGRTWKHLQGEKNVPA